MDYVQESNVTTIGISANNSTNATMLIQTILNQIERLERDVKEYKTQLLRWKWRQRLAQISPRFQTFSCFDDLDDFDDAMNGIERLIRDIWQQLRYVNDNNNQFDPIQKQQLWQINTKVQHLVEQLPELSVVVAWQPHPFSIKGTVAQANPRIAQQYHCRPILRILGGELFGWKQLNVSKEVQCKIITENEAIKYAQNPQHVSIDSVAKLMGKAECTARFGPWGDKKLFCAEFQNLTLTDIVRDNHQRKRTNGQTRKPGLRFYFVFTVELSGYHGISKKVNLLSFPVHLYVSKSQRFYPDNGDALYWWYIISSRPPVDDPELPIEVWPESGKTVYWDNAVEEAIERQFLRYVDEPQEAWKIEYHNAPAPPRRISQEGMEHIRMRLCRSDATLSYDNIAMNTQQIDKERNNEVFEIQKYSITDGKEILVACPFFDYLRETALMVKDHFASYWNSEKNEIDMYQPGFILGFVSKLAAENKVADHCMLIRFSDRRAGSISICYKVPNKLPKHLDIRAKLLVNEWTLAKLIKTEQRLEDVHYIYPSYNKEDFLSIDENTENPTQVASDRYNFDASTYFFENRLVIGQRSNQGRHCKTCRCHEQQQQQLLENLSEFDINMTSQNDILNQATAHIPDFFMTTTDQPIQHQQITTPSPTTSSFLPSPVTDDMAYNTILSPLNFLSETPF